MLLCPILYVALVIIPTVRSRDTFKRVPFPPRATWRSSGTAPTRREGLELLPQLSGFVQRVAALHTAHSTFPAPKVAVRVRACVCVCLFLCVSVCARARARARAITGLHYVSSEMVCRPSCVYAQGGQINISEEQYELNHFLNNKTRPHASS